MSSAITISRNGWDKVYVSCPPNIMKGVKKACIDADIVPSQLVLTLFNMIASGDVKLAVNPKCRSYPPNMFMRVVELESNFDVARVKVSTLDGIPINTTPFSDNDL